MSFVMVKIKQKQWLRWSRGSVLAFGTQVRGFKPGRSRRIFQGEKILSTPSFGKEVKPFVPCRRFTACKRSLNVTWKSGIFRQNSSAISRPSSSSFHYQGFWWRHLAVQVGKTKDQGSKISLRLQCIRGHQTPGPYHNTKQYNTALHIDLQKFKSTKYTSRRQKELSIFTQFFYSDLKPIDDGRKLQGTNF